ncbi:MAG: ATP-grasp domain-containing protein [Chloroflexi bacterium]|nr:ATP-grasp domain-containing protein [Chloroflexota bacterium]
MPPPPRPPRVILLASARSYRSKAFTGAARKLGLEVVRGKDVPLPMLPGVEAGLPLDYRDLRKSTEAIIRYAEGHPVGAIVGADDSGALLAAHAGEALGLPHNAPQAAAAARNKGLMRRRFAAAGVRSPRFRLYHLSDDPEEIADDLDGQSGPAGLDGAAGGLRFPVVLKPTELAGSRGVMRADDPIQLIQRFERLRGILATERCDEVLIEEFIPGAEVALEGLLDGGQLAVLALFDKPDPLDGPYFEETIYVTPSRLPDETQQAIFAETLRAAAALGLREGPIHAELRVNEGGPWLVEVAARSIGGLCSQTLRFGAEMSLEELILRQAFGLEVQSVQREGRAGGVMMIPIPAAGLLKEVHGLEAATCVPLIESVEITAKANYPLVPLPEGDSYLGFIFARGETPQAVESALRAAHAQLGFEIAPEIALRATRRD